MQNPLEGAVTNSVTDVEKGLVHLIVGSTPEFVNTEIARVIAEILKSGHTAKHNGITQFITHDEIIDPTKDGSAQYIWNKSGIRTKHNTVKVTAKKDGTVTKEVIGTSFRS